MEHNRLIREFTNAPLGNEGIGEQKTVGENPLVKERGEGTISNKNGNSPKKKNLKNILSVVAALSTVAVGMSAVTPIQETFSPVDGVKVQLMEFGENEDGVFYHLNVDSETPLFVVLYNDFTNRRQALQQGGNGGVFENLKAGMTYTFAVVGKGVLGEKEILSQTVKIRHPIEYAYAEFREYGIADTFVYYHVYKQSRVPLTVVLTDGSNRWEQPLVYEDENGVATEEEIAEIPGEFVIEIEQDKRYVLSIVGEGLYGEEYTVLSQTLEMA